jgi:hypothetical protein
MSGAARPLTHLVVVRALEERLDLRGSAVFELAQLGRTRLHCLAPARPGLIAHAMRPNMGGVEPEAFLPSRITELRSNSQRQLDTRRPDRTSEAGEPDTRGSVRGSFGTRRSPRCSPAGMAHRRIARPPCDRRPLSTRAVRSLIARATHDTCRVGRPCTKRPRPVVHIPMRRRGRRRRGRDRAAPREPCHREDR